MNGKDLLESMGYVDEKYIQQAASPMRRRSSSHWRALAAAAACLAVVILGVRALLPAKQENFAMMQRSAMEDQAAVRSKGADAAVVENTIAPIEADNGVAPMTTAAGTNDTFSMTQATPEGASSGTAEMVVRVLRQEADALVCVVTDPGTGSYGLDCEIRIALPDAGIALADEVSGSRQDVPAPAAGVPTQAAVSAETIQGAMTAEAATEEATEETIQETAQETEEISADNQAVYLRVTYLPGEDSLIHPLSMTALEDEK